MRQLCRKERSPQFPPNIMFARDCAHLTPTTTSCSKLCRLITYSRHLRCLFYDRIYHSCTPLTTLHIDTLTLAYPLFFRFVRIAIITITIRSKVEKTNNKGRSDYQLPQLRNALIEKTIYFRIRTTIYQHTPPNTTITTKQGGSCVVSLHPFVRRLGRQY